MSQRTCSPIVRRMKKAFGSTAKQGDGEFEMLDTAELGTPREGKTIKTGNILKEGRGSTVFSKGISLTKRFFTLYVEDGRPTLKYLNSETSEVLGVCDLTDCVISKSKNPRKDASGIFPHCMRLDMKESPVNTNRDKLKLTLCFNQRAEMNSWFDFAARPHATTLPPSFVHPPTPIHT